MNILRLLMLIMEPARGRAGTLSHSPDPMQSFPSNAKSTDLRASRPVRRHNLLPSGMGSFSVAPPQDCLGCFAEGKVDPGWWMELPFLTDWGHGGKR